MDCLEFVASIVGSVAWPAAVVASVFLFRKELKRLMPLLQLKYKDLDISFRLSAAEKDAAELPPVLPEIIPTPEETDRFAQIAELSPRAAILEVRVDLLDALTSLAMASNVPTAKTSSMLALMRSLRSKDIINSQTSALLDDLRVLGNNAAHNSQSSFTKDDALRYRSLANQAIAQLRVKEMPT